MTLAARKSLASTKSGAAGSVLVQAGDGAGRANAVESCQDVGQASSDARDAAGLDDDASEPTRMTLPPSTMPRVTEAALDPVRVPPRREAPFVLSDSAAPRESARLEISVLVSPSSRRSASALSAEEEASLTRRCTACETRYPSDFLVCPRDASPLVDESDANLAKDPLVGRLLGDTYQIIRRVGEGGMGRVYEARHLRLRGRRFAVKVLHAELAQDSEIVARFLREAESASSLEHPNVVDVFDVHHLPDGRPYFVGEFLDGEELAARVRERGALAPCVVATVGRQVCRALAAAHARGIVHRDVKPENVFILKSSVEALAFRESSALTIKVFDFGISKAQFRDRESLTRAGVVMGTPSFMAPEQARGNAVDLRADVYSTGALLYFALAGRRPFEGPDPSSILSMVLSQEPPRLRSLDPSIPEELARVVERAMAKDARDRFQTMAEFDLELAVFDDSARPRRQGGETFGATASPRELTRSVHRAIVTRSLALALWLICGTAASVSGLVRVLNESEITRAESVLLIVGCAFAAASPFALYAWLVKRIVWASRGRAKQLAQDLRRTASVALVTFGSLSIASRVGHTVMWRNSKDLSSGWWDMALFAASLVAALTFGEFGRVFRNLRRRRSS